MILVPLLYENFRSDVLIATFADDKYVYKRDLLQLLVTYMDNKGVTISGMRVRQIGLCSTKPWLFSISDKVEYF